MLAEIVALRCSFVRNDGGLAVRVLGNDGIIGRNDGGIIGLK